MHFEREVQTRQPRLEGFVIFDHLSRFDETEAKLAKMLAEGSVRYTEDVECDIAKAPQALVDVYAGKKKGKKLIWLR